MTQEKTTALTTTQETAVATFNYYDPRQFEAVQRVAKMLACSDLVPDTYRPTKERTLDKAIANCVVALDTAQRIGANPLAVMQNMVVIYGRPSWSSQFLISTVNTCGRFQPLRFRFTERGTVGMIDYAERQGGRMEHRQYDGRNIQDIECVAYTTEKGSSDILESSPVSIRMAILEGWYTKNGSKWQTMPKQMLMYRAAAFWTRTYAPELSLGMRTIEEERDIATTDYEETTAAATLAAQKEQHANKEEIAIAIPDDVETVAVETAPEQEEQPTTPHENKEKRKKEQPKEPKEPKEPTSDSDSSMPQLGF